MQYTTCRNTIKSSSDENICLNENNLIGSCTVSNHKDLKAVPVTKKKTSLKRLLALFYAVDIFINLFKFSSILGGAISLGRWIDAGSRDRMTRLRNRTRQQVYIVSPFKGGHMRQMPRAP